MSEDLLELLPVILIALVSWLLGLTVVFYWVFKHYKRLASKVKVGDLVKVLNRVLDAEEKNKANLLQLKKELAKVDADSEKHLQKLGLVRFNPFNETGGDQSFSLSLLDKYLDGFVLTGLHTRDRTRIYAKPVKKGKSGYELSKEESKAIKEAVKNK